MSSNQTCFEVKVTPNYKKRAPLEPSPILILEKFKGTPSLTFKDVKVGSSPVKGLWIENPNDCIITVILSKIPPVERGLVFSETEFMLEANSNRRITVIWTPTCEGSWRDVVQVQVWGLPPPHLSFRVVLHLTSVQPKIKRKCCQMSLPPLKSHNARSAKVQPGMHARPNVRSGCCRSHACPKAENGKENILRKESKLVIETRSNKRQPAIDRDSLEDNALPGKKQTDDFLAVEDGLLPPCNIPSTPIRRSTYNVNHDHLESGPRISSKPSVAATFTVQEDQDQHLNKSHRGKLGFLEALEGNWFSPPVLSQSMRKEEEILSLETPSNPISSLASMSQWTLQPGSERCSTEVKQKNIASLSEKSLAKLLFPDVDEEEKDDKYMPNQSSPLHYGAAKCHATPQCSPVLSIGQDYPSKEANVSLFCVTGFHDSDGKSCTGININYTYNKETCDNLKLETVQMACSVIQRNWRRVRAERRMAKMRAENLEIMEKASSIIQRNWRLVTAKRQAAKERTEMLEAMQKACFIIQKNWRLVKAKRLAAKERAEILEAREKASSIIQRNWRLVRAKRLAAKERAEMLEAREKASSIIQRNWRLVIAKRLAAKERAEMLEAREKASSIIQRNWRLVRAKRQAAKERAEMLEAREKASSIIQRNWRLLRAKRHAAKERAEMLEAREKASSIIQRNWRLVRAKRQAAKERAEMLEAREKASSIIQRNWRLLRAKRHAAKERAEMLEAREKASSIIQRNWRLLMAKRQAAKERAEMLEAREKASSIIQRNWRLLRAKRHAAKERAEMLEAREKASSIIQRNWRIVRAKRQAVKERTEMLEAREKASFIIQRNWRLVTAKRQAAKERTEMLEAREKASSIIQRNWRIVRAKRQAVKERAEMLEAMQKACSIIQRSWRLVIAERQAGLIREETSKKIKASTVIQRNWRRCLARRREKKSLAAHTEEASGDAVLSKHFEKFHLKPRAYELLFELATLHADEDLSTPIMLIQQCVRNGERMGPKEIALLKCEKATQTNDVEKEFIKPVTQSQKKSRQTSNLPSMTNSCRTSRRSILTPKCRKSRVMPLARSLSPIKRKNLKGDLPEKESWRNVAEAVGRKDFPGQKKNLVG